MISWDAWRILIITAVICICLLSLRYESIELQSLFLREASSSIGKTSGVEKENRTLIRHIFQNGPPRTASTTQFNILCVSLFLHIRTFSPELLNNTLCTMAGSFTNDDKAYKYTIQQSNIPQVVKSHVTEPDPRHIHKSTYVFATARNVEEANKTKSMLYSKGLNVGIVQDLQSLKTLGINHWLKIYAIFFGLTSDELELMYEYFKLWDKLRQCCGMQMSQHYRNYLLPSKDKNTAIEDHPFCNTLDPNNLEKNFMETKLFKLMSRYPLMRRINRPATVDGDLDGRYCSRYEALVKDNGIPLESHNNAGLNSRYAGLENHWSDELGDPFVGLHDLINNDSCDGEKYLFFTSANGFANLLRGIEVAMRIAYSTNRTVIMPPLLPHKFAKPFGGFKGRDLYNLTHDVEWFTYNVNVSLTDVAMVTSLSGRSDLPALNFDDMIHRTGVRPGEFYEKGMSLSNGTVRTSWSAVLNFDDVSNRTGVKLIDLYDFVNLKSNSCMEGFLRQPSPPIPLITLLNRSATWLEFIELFEKQYESHPVTLIGNTYELHELFSEYDSHAQESISDGVHNLAFSTKVVELLKIARNHLPSDYVSVHLRTGDEADRKIQTCTDKAIVNEYNKVMKSMERTNVTRGSTVYIASNDDKAKECFDEFTKNMYKVLNLEDVFEADGMSDNSMRNIMGTLSIDLNTKYLLLDLHLIANGAEIYLAMINFDKGQYYSTFQVLMAKLADGIVRDCSSADSEEIKPDNCNTIKW